MTLQQKVKDALAARAPFQSGEHLLEAEHAGQQFACELVTLDSLACATTRLALRSDSLRSMSAEQLKAVAQNLSARLTYLLEPISPIEVDAQGCTVQLRSQPPHKSDEGTSYYELLVSRLGEISLRRYARQPGGKRSVIAAHLTREVLLRLAADFAAVLA